MFGMAYTGDLSRITFKYLTNNPRLAMTVRTLEKMKPERKAKIYAAADKFLEEHTYTD